MGTPPDEASNQDDECSICYASTIREMRAQGQQGKLDCCGHGFCFGCIRKWASEVTNSCPLCKRSISELERVGRGGVVLETLAIAARKVRPPEPTEAELRAMQEEADAEDNCVVCGSGEQDELLLLCDSCNCAYHTFCLTPRLRAVPSGDWFCPDCHATAAPTQPEEGRGWSRGAGRGGIREAFQGGRGGRAAAQPEVIVLDGDGASPHASPHASAATVEEEEGEEDVEEDVGARVLSEEGGVIRRVVRTRHNVDEGGAVEFEARTPATP